MQKSILAFTRKAKISDPNEPRDTWSSPHFALFFMTCKIIEIYLQQRKNISLFYRVKVMWKIIHFFSCREIIILIK